MIDSNITAAAARLRLREAEKELMQAEAMLGDQCGVALGAALLNRIRATAREVRRARNAVRTVDPNCPDTKVAFQSTG